VRRLKNITQVARQLEARQVRQVPALVPHILFPMLAQRGGDEWIGAALAADARHVLKAHDEEREPVCDLAYVVGRAAALHRSEEWLCSVACLCQLDGAADIANACTSPLPHRRELVGLRGQVSGNARTAAAAPQ
jgi:hypothetical protein